ncbi:MAG: diaminohydroxyphosphoribosylaminopyrimidine deaminase [Lentimonas sp.]|jgi:diaminohydroxyphosphoribosylaminopyrimidine deaminase/5-amino-6-(5-phosphoribosylamino)uracil reductase
MSSNERFEASGFRSDESWIANAWGGKALIPFPLHPIDPMCSTPVSESDRRFMCRAIELACTVSEEAVSPNPRVGAVIVEFGEIVAEGFHSHDGGPHAERVALESLGRLPKHGAQMFVTLEPCSTSGRTGSCCERIIKSQGIRRVLIGCLDPNPAHAGRALDVLRSRGIEVVCAVERAACEALNPRFNRQMRAV